MTRIFDPAMLALPYMQNAFAAATIVALLAGFLGFFVVVRGASFAAHAYAQMGFAGAAGAVLVGVDPLLGLVAFAVGGAALNGLIGDRAHNHDVSTALLMVAALGTGALFLVLNNTFATAAFSLLFGSIVGVSRVQVAEVAVLASGCALALAFIYRPLLFVTVNREAARARGVPAFAIGVAFSTLLAVSAAIAVPTVGTLLIFSLLVGPAATATRLARAPLAAIALAMALAVGVTWAGIVAAYDTGWPVGFFITGFVMLAYLAARAFARPRTTTRSSLASTPVP